MKIMEVGSVKRTLAEEIYTKVKIMRRNNDTAKLLSRAL